MRRLDDDADAARLHHLVDRLGDLRGQLFLDLEPLGIDLDETHQLARTVNRDTFDFTLAPSVYDLTVPPVDLDLGADAAGTRQTVRVVPAWHTSSVVFTVP